MESIAPLGPAKQNLILLGINFSQFFTRFLCILVNLVQLLLQRNCESLHQCHKKTSKTTSMKHHTWLMSKLRCSFTCKSTPANFYILQSNANIIYLDILYILDVYLTNRILHKSIHFPQKLHNADLHSCTSYLSNN